MCLYDIGCSGEDRKDCACTTHLATWKGNYDVEKPIHMYNDLVSYKCADGQSFKENGIIQDFQQFTCGWDGNWTDYDPIDPLMPCACE